MNSLSGMRQLEKCNGVGNKVDSINFYCDKECTEGEWRIILEVAFNGDLIILSDKVITYDSCGHDSCNELRKTLYSHQLGNRPFQSSPNPECYPLSSGFSVNVS